MLCVVVATVFHKRFRHVGESISSSLAFNIRLSVSHSNTTEYNERQQEKHGLLIPKTTNTPWYSLASSNSNANLQPRRQMPLNHLPRCRQRRTTLSATPPNQLPHPLPLPPSLLRNQRRHPPSVVPLQASREREEYSFNTHAPPRAHPTVATVDLHWRP